MCAARLITIPFSHYCEKARWGLRHCDVVFFEDGYLPLMHVVPVLRAGGKRTVPVLVAGDRTLASSTDILQWADNRAPRTRRLYPPALRRQIAELEQRFDNKLGPATRRWVYGQLLSQRDSIADMAADKIPRWQAAVIPLWLRPFSLVVRRALNISPASVQRSYDRVERIFDEVAKRLADGRAYLVGEQFTAADLTFAALAAPVLLPEGYGAKLPPVVELPERARVQVQAWRAHPAGAFALELYRQHREPARSPTKNFV